MNRLTTTADALKAHLKAATLTSVAGALTEASAELIERGQCEAAEFVMALAVEKMHQAVALYEQLPETDRA